MCLVHSLVGVLFLGLFALKSIRHPCVHLFGPLWGVTSANYNPYPPLPASSWMDLANGRSGWEFGDGLLSVWPVSPAASVPLDSSSHHSPDFQFLRIWAAVPSPGFLFHLPWHGHSWSLGCLTIPCWLSSSPDLLIISSVTSPELSGLNSFIFLTGLWLKELVLHK